MEGKKMNTKMIGLVLVGFLILVVAAYGLTYNNSEDAPGTQGNSTIESVMGISGLLA